MENENSSPNLYVEEGQDDGVVPNIEGTDDAVVPNEVGQESSGLRLFPEDTTETESSACSSVDTELPRSTSSSEHESEANDKTSPLNRRKVLKGDKQRHISLSQKLAKNQAYYTSTEESSSSVDSKKTGKNCHRSVLSEASGGTALDDTQSSEPRDESYYGSLEETPSSEPLNEAFSSVSLEKSGVPMDETTSSMPMEKIGVPMDETQSSELLDEAALKVPVEKSSMPLDEIASSVPLEKNSVPTDEIYPSKSVEETESSEFHTKDCSEITSKERLSLKPDKLHDTSTEECHEQKKNKNRSVAESRDLSKTEQDTDDHSTDENIVTDAASTCSATMGSSGTPEDSLNLTHRSIKRSRIKTDTADTTELDAKRKKSD